MLRETVPGFEVWESAHLEMSWSFRLIVYRFFLVIFGPIYS